MEDCSFVSGRPSLFVRMEEISGPASSLPVDFSPGQGLAWVFIKSVGGTHVWDTFERATTPLSAWTATKELRTAWVGAFILPRWRRIDRSLFSILCHNTINTHSTTTQSRNFQFCNISTVTMSTKPADAASKKQEEEGDREAITLPGSKTIYGICCRKNDDGTNTWYPKTKVAFFSPHDYKTIKEHVPAEEVKLLETNFVKGISDTDEHRKKRSGLPEPSPEWRESLDLYYSIQQASDKEYLFVATRHFEKQRSCGCGAFGSGSERRVCRGKLPRSSVGRSTSHN